MATLVPGDSAPAKVAGLGLLPVTAIGKSAATLVPPSSLITCLITINCGALSSLVMVQVLVSPSAMFPEQPLYEAAYAGSSVSVTENEPALMATLVPGDSAPAKVAGLGLLPVTAIGKLDAVLTPPLSSITCLITINWGAWSELVTVQVLD